jgi:hypothetical protein
MNVTGTNRRRPIVRLIGNADHTDFAESMSLLRAAARLESAHDALPELIVVAQTRQGEVSHREVKSIHQQYPLAGTIALLGSWCEGETRTGLPWPGVTRLYWYEFPTWWHRQLLRHTNGLCPDWANQFSSEVFTPTICNSRGTAPLWPTVRNCCGVILLSAQYSGTVDSLADVLSRAGFATVHQPRGNSHPVVRGATAAIWEGGQLSVDETGDLSKFCQRLSHDGTPVIVLLDYPRHDAVARAYAAGASIVLGKPWLNANLIDALHFVSEQQAIARAA